MTQPNVSNMSRETPERQPTRKRRRCPARRSSGGPRKVKANLTCLKTMKWCSNLKNRRSRTTATESQAVSAEM